MPLLAATTTAQRGALHARAQRCGRGAAAAVRGCGVTRLGLLPATQQQRLQQLRKRRDGALLAPRAAGERPSSGGAVEEDASAGSAGAAASGSDSGSSGADAESDQLVREFKALMEEAERAGGAKALGGGGGSGGSQDSSDGDDDDEAGAVAGALGSIAIEAARGGLSVALAGALGIGLFESTQ